ncbi:MAG: OsmC family protein [Anaerolineae bacterium]|nr:OsmC family protein [Anaerolineae bacterium]
MAITTFKAVSRKLPQGLSVENKVRNFTVIMDEPASLGGTDTGITPVEAMLTALGSCQCIVAAAFAKAKKINLEEVWVELEGDLDPNGFLKGEEGVRNGFQEVRLKLHLKSDASKEQLENFAAFINSRCPVEDNLLNATPVVSELVVERA